MTYKEAITLFADMESRFNDGFSSKDRAIINHLYFFIFAKEIENKGCSDCYRDAYILIRTRLKTLGKMPTKSNYTLKAGAIIHPVGTSKFYTNPLPSDEIAEEFLSKFPEQIGIFAAFPHDWEDRVAKYKAKSAQKTAEPIKSDQSEVLEAVKAQNKALKAENESLKAELEHVKQDKAQKEEKISELTAENESLKAEQPATTANDDIISELARVNEELSSLKAENKALKAANTKLKNSTKEERAE